MHFRDIGRNRFGVYKSAKDDKFYGTVEREEYVSIDMATGKRTVKRIWKAYGRAGGWREANNEQFATREDAGAFLIKEAATPYGKKKSHWTKRQGESAALKAAQKSDA